MSMLQSGADTSRLDLLSINDSSTDYPNCLQSAEIFAQCCSQSVAVTWTQPSSSSSKWCVTGWLGFSSVLVMWTATTTRTRTASAVSGYLDWHFGLSFVSNKYQKKEKRRQKQQHEKMWKNERKDRSANGKCAHNICTCMYVCVRSRTQNEAIKL